MTPAEAVLPMATVRLRGEGFAVLPRILDGAQLRRLAAAGDRLAARAGGVLRSVGGRRSCPDLLDDHEEVQSDDAQVG